MQKKRCAQDVIISRKLFCKNIQREKSDICVLFPGQPIGTLDGLRAFVASIDLKGNMFSPGGYSENMSPGSARTPHPRKSKCNSDASAVLTGSPGVLT